jgi:predicted ArsR family transcriptional regulator
VESTSAFDDAVDLLCALDDEVRRACYQHVRRADAPLTRAEVAAAVGIAVGLAAFHLDKLVAVGLLDADYGGTPGRGGGRPAKRYRPSVVALEVTLPPRRYDVLARILAEAADTGESRHAVARRTGVEAGRAHRRGSREARLREALAELGFEPADTDAAIVQRNCPFAAAQQVAPPLVCEVNRAIVDGVLDAVDAAASRRSVLDPAPGRCCVLIVDR